MKTPSKLWLSTDPLPLVPTNNLSFSANNLVTEEFDAQEISTPEVSFPETKTRFLMPEEVLNSPPKTDNELLM